MKNGSCKHTAHRTNNPSAIQSYTEAPKMESKKSESPLVKQ